MVANEQIRVEIEVKILSEEQREFDICTYMEMDQYGLRLRVKFKRKNPQAKENIQARTTLVHLREYPRIQLFESSAKYEASPKAGGPKHCLLYPKQQSRN